MLALFLTALSLTSAYTCEPCVELLDHTLNVLVEGAISVGIGGGCAEVCGYLGNPIEVELCTGICTAAGAYEFITALQEDDTDPVYLCAAFHACNKNTCLKDCVSIDAVSVTPSTGKTRTTFELTASLNVHAQTGVGMTYLLVTNKNMPKGQTVVEFSKLADGYAAGTKVNVTASVETDEMDWNWPAGTYPVTAITCAYDCQDQHGIIYDQKSGHFTITQ
mmetsp:Transcript_2488/g.7950  ORF Transcript_2488/g.7950 Transcript_2488/m.7950 type:complete len:220 (+) Transcript_2488:397-1056(+)